MKTHLHVRSVECGVIAHSGRTGATRDCRLASALTNLQPAALLWWGCWVSTVTLQLIYSAAVGWGRCGAIHVEIVNHRPQTTSLEPSALCTRGIIHIDRLWAFSHTIKKCTNTRRRTHLLEKDLDLQRTAGTWRDVLPVVEVLKRNLELVAARALVVVHLLRVFVDHLRQVHLFIHNCGHISARIRIVLSGSWPCDGRVVPGLQSLRFGGGYYDATVPPSSAMGRENCAQ